MVSHMSVGSQEAESRNRGAGKFCLCCYVIFLLYFFELCGAGPGIEYCSLASASAPAFLTFRASCYNVDIHTWLNQSMFASASHPPSMGLLSPCCCIRRVYVHHYTQFMEEATFDEAFQVRGWRSPPPFPLQGACAATADGQAARSVGAR